MDLEIMESRIEMLEEENERIKVTLKNIDRRVNNPPDENKKLRVALDAARSELLETQLELHKLQSDKQYSVVRAIGRFVLRRK